MIKKKKKPSVLPLMKMYWQISRPYRACNKLSSQKPLYTLYALDQSTKLPHTRSQSCSHTPMFIHRLPPRLLHIFSLILKFLHSLSLPWSCPTHLHHPPLAPSAIVPSNPPTKFSPPFLQLTRALSNLVVPGGQPPPSHPPLLHGPEDTGSWMARTVIQRSFSNSPQRQEPHLQDT